MCAQATGVHWQAREAGANERCNLKRNPLMLPCLFKISNYYMKRLTYRMLNAGRQAQPPRSHRAGPGAEAHWDALQEPLPQLSAVLQRHTLHAGGTQPWYTVSAPTCLPSGFCQPRNGGRLQDEEAGGHYISEELERRDAILLAKNR